MSAGKDVPFFGRGPSELKDTAITLIQDEAGGSRGPAVLLDFSDIAKVTGQDIPQAAQLARLQELRANPLVASLGFTHQQVGEAQRLRAEERELSSQLQGQVLPITTTSGKQFTGGIETTPGREPRVSFGFTGTEDALEFATFAASKTGKNVLQGFQNPELGFQEQAIQELGSLISLSPTRSRTAAGRAASGRSPLAKKSASVLAL